MTWVKADANINPNDVAAPYSLFGVGTRRHSFWGLHFVLHPRCISSSGVAFRCRSPFSVRQHEGCFGDVHVGHVLCGIGLHEQALRTNRLRAIYGHLRQPGMSGGTAAFLLPFLSLGARTCCCCKTNPVTQDTEWWACPKRYKGERAGR